MLKSLKHCIYILLSVQIGYSGTIEGTVYRKSGSVNTLKINRYSLRQSPSKETNGTAVNVNLAVIYLTGPGLEGLEVTSSPKIVQKNLAFEPWLLPVQAGTTVQFPNMDLVFHNVFSYSKAKKFDLGRYAKGQSKPVLFDQPGLVQVFCEIHRTMRAYVIVLENSYFTVTNDQGIYKIEDIPEGKYVLHVWQENIEEYITKIEIAKDKKLILDIK